MGKITEQTLIPISLVAGLAAVMYWLAGVSIQGTATAAQLDELAKKVATIEQMKTDIEVIKSKVDDIHRILRSK